MKGASELKHEGAIGADRQRERHADRENWRDTGAKADRGQREKRGQRRRRGERRRGGEGRGEEREICGDWSPFIHSAHLAYLAGAGNEISSF